MHSIGSGASASLGSRSKGQVTLWYETNYYGLSPEQFVLGDYHDVF